MTISIFKGSDASAPAWSGAIGSVEALFDACLIDGYGAKSAAPGWTKPFTSGTGNAAYRYTGEAGHNFLKVLDDGNAGDEVWKTTFRAYEGMTAIDAGTYKYPPYDSMWYNYLEGIFEKQDNATDTTPEWIMIVNKGNIFLAASLTSSIDTSFIYSTATFYFGKFKSPIPDDQYNNLISVTSGSNSSCNGGICATVENSTWTNRDVTGTTLGTMVYPTAGHLSGQWGSNLGTNPRMPYPWGGIGGMMITNLEIQEEESEGVHVRGFVPGIWVPCHNRPLTNKDEFTAHVGGKLRDFIVVESAGGGSPGQVFLEISDTWEF